MPDTPFLPPLKENWEPTRATLHAYAHALDSVPRALGVSHPKWWHISLKVRPHGLVSDNVSLPGGGIITLALDLRRHSVVIDSSRGDTTALSMTEGATATEMGDQILAAVGDLGLEGEFNRSKFESDEPREYDREAAEIFFSALVNVNQVFEQHRVLLEGPVSPVQLWPHGFDLAVEWFGTRVETFEDNGEVTEHPSQINLGFYPGGRPYFYSNPWPFDESFPEKPLPHEAEWQTEDWQGSIYYYDLLAGDPDAAQKLAEYARAVHEIAAPTLMV